MQNSVCTCNTNVTSLSERYLSYYISFTSGGPPERRMELSSGEINLTLGLHVCDETPHLLTSAMYEDDKALHTARTLSLLPLCIHALLSIDLDT